MRLIAKERPFLESILKEANRYKRQDMLAHANADQINAVSELVLNLLKNNIPVNNNVVQRLKKYKRPLRELGKRKNSVKRRRQQLLQQQGGTFWSGLKDTFQTCLCTRRV